MWKGTTLNRWVHLDVKGKNLLRVPCLSIQFSPTNAWWFCLGFLTGIGYPPCCRNRNFLCWDSAAPSDYSRYLWQRNRVDNSQTADCLPAQRLSLRRRHRIPSSLLWGTAYRMSAIYLDILTTRYPPGKKLKEWNAKLVFWSLHSAEVIYIVI